MSGSDIGWWWIVIAFVVGTPLGSGAISQWMTWRLERRKQKFDEALKLADLRKRISDLQHEIIVSSNEYVRLRDEYETQKDSTLGNQMNQVESRLTLAKDDFSKLEAQLSQLEGREPREIRINFIVPSRPTGFTIE